MEVKKSPKADLENKRSTYVLIGLVMVLSLMYIALEWTQTEIKKIEVVSSFIDDGEEEMVAQTMHDDQPPPPPPPAAVVQEVLNIVANTVITETVIVSTEGDEDKKIEIPVFVPSLQEEEHEDEIFTIVEEQPSYPGGDKARIEFFNKTIKYPTIAQENGIQGTVYVTFVVNKDGKIVDVQVVRGADPNLDKEAVRVVSAMPPWNPAKQRGKSVRARFTLPVRFTLR